MDLIVVPDAPALAERGADLFVSIVAEAIEARGEAMVALSGGSTPEKMYAVLASRPVDWSKVRLFFGDERFVPADDPASNYRMARRALLEPAGVPLSSVFPVDTSVADAGDAARRYDGVLRAAFRAASPPRFDLILLGLGDDGHTASLFPGMPSLGVTDEWVVASPPGTLPPPVERVTCTFPVLNAARHVVFLVSDEKKAGVLADVLEGSPTCEQRPAACVRPTDGNLIWLVDQAAASRLAVSSR